MSGVPFTPEQRDAFEAFGAAWTRLTRVEQAISGGQGASFVHHQALAAMQAAAQDLRAALTIPAPAGAVAGERWLPFWELYEVPRLSGGVLSIGHDIDPDRPMDTLSTTVIRHEFRGRVREVEVTHGENPYERLRAAEWRKRDIPADDLLEALKIPMPGRTP